MNFCSDSKDIRKEMNDFYKDIFSEKVVDLEVQDWLLDQLSMSLDEQEQASCEGCSLLRSVSRRLMEWYREISWY